jgi:hypothetical protein
MSHAQIQPLSLEELLAKKKAEEEAEAKVRLWHLDSCALAVLTNATTGQLQRWSSRTEKSRLQYQWFPLRPVHRCRCRCLFCPYSHLCGLVSSVLIRYFLMELPCQEAAVFPPCHLTGCTCSPCQSPRPLCSFIRIFTMLSEYLGPSWVSVAVMWLDAVNHSLLS